MYTRHSVETVLKGGQRDPLHVYLFLKSEVQGTGVISGPRRVCPVDVIKTTE